MNPMGSIMDADHTCSLTSSQAVRDLLWSLYRPTKCWPKTNRLPIISSAKKKKGGLFRVSRELQLCVCNHGGPCASSYTGRERKPANTEKKEAGSIVVNPVHGFSLAESLSGNEGFFFFLLGSAMVKGHESSPFWSPNSI